MVGGDFLRVGNGRRWEEERVCMRWDGWGEGECFIFSQHSCQWKYINSPLFRVEFRDFFQCFLRFFWRVVFVVNFNLRFFYAFFLSSIFSSILFIDAWTKKKNWRVVFVVNFLRLTPTPSLFRLPSLSTQKILRQPTTTSVATNFWTWKIILNLR